MTSNDNKGPGCCNGSPLKKQVVFQAAWKALRVRTRVKVKVRVRVRV